MDKVDLETKIRKYSTNMRLSAYGVILFGAWSVIKGILYLVFNTGVFDALLGIGSIPKESKTLAISVLFAIQVLDLIVRILIGRAAILESKGHKRGIGYIIIGFLLISFYVYNDVANFPSVFELGSTNMIIDQIVSLILDITSIYAMADLIYSSIRYKALGGGADAG